ncbi:hypothetical protein [Chengkuizengella axinellae]|uniref:Peptidase C39 domain-containing protein n=1 Tax=Chengkuizengella axinellae TaxID=3064388 RepID=A0ABT9J3U0_9BACL|nr:hypothetical protein [Chengkuizengella sp. 2205SS18-9]MDP5276260.1 hypothetical protein [Chengkuizengella sp. 2205SS18-9]
MDFSIHTMNLISLLTTSIGWSMIAFLVFRTYKKSQHKPKVWKVIVITYVGLFSLSIDWIITDSLLKIPLLPLGVWVLYLIFKRKQTSWQTYRSFAWIGFLSNFVFILCTLIYIPIYQTLYPTNDISTFVSNIDHAEIIHSHPSAENVSLNKDKLLEQLDAIKQVNIDSAQWYEDVILLKKEERFPYLLIETLPKWGSGSHAVIYIENDGKGLILQTENKQFYFRSEHSFLKEGNRAESK